MNIKNWIIEITRKHLWDTGILSVPHIKQFNDYACGCAVLEMAYKYHGLSNVSQREIYTKSKKLNLGGGNWILKEETLLADAKNRGFFSVILQLTLDNVNDGVDVLVSFINLQLPVIVCQQWEVNSPIGHFRIVTGVDKKFVYFRDPNVHSSSECLRWEHHFFFDHWKPNGKMVLGNTLIVIAKKGSKLPPIMRSALKEQQII